MEAYDNKNVHGDARIILSLGGIGLSPYYAAGVSTANLILTETVDVYRFWG